MIFFSVQELMAMKRVLDFDEIEGDRDICRKILHVLWNDSKDFAERMELAYVQTCLEAGETPVPWEFDEAMGAWRHPHYTFTIKRSENGSISVAA